MRHSILNSKPSGILGAKGVLLVEIFKKEDFYGKVKGKETKMTEDVFLHSVSM